MSLERRHDNGKENFPTLQIRARFALICTGCVAILQQCLGVEKQL
jgi:hypothetical protein